jgi:hypothetical protein
MPSTIPTASSPGSALTDVLDAVLYALQIIAARALQLVYGPAPAQGQIGEAA